jgi:signal transduction histidine kinase
VALPASVAGRVAGVLAFFFADPFEPEPALLELLSALGSQLGQFIERRRAEERAEAELRASRGRILAGARAERRRLEGELHAGVQQRLSSLLITLRLLWARLPGDAEGASEMLRAADAELVAALDELREFGRGIHPAVLTHQGLGPALSSLAERAPLEIASVAASRLPESIEAAAYDVVREVAESAGKEGRGPVRVAVSCEEGRALVLIEERGPSDPEAPHLRAVSDSAEGAGGSLAVEERPDGRRLVVELPLP